MDHVESYVIDGGYQVFYSTRHTTPIAVIDHPEDRVRIECIEHTYTQLNVYKLYRGSLITVRFIPGERGWRRYGEWSTRAEEYPFWDPHPPGAPPVYVARDQIPNLAAYAIDAYTYVRDRALSAIAREGEAVHERLLTTSDDQEYRGAPSAQEVVLYKSCQIPRPR